MSFILIKHFEGFYIFSEEEFDNRLRIEALCRAIESEFCLKLFSKKNTTIRLNDVLKVPDLFDLVKNKKTVVLPSDIESLARTTQSSRRSKFDEMSYFDRVQLVKLNRLILENVYSDICPKHTIQKRYIHTITTHEVEKYYDSLEDTPYEANRQLAFLNLIFGKAADKGCLDKNPVTGIDDEDRYAEKRYSLNLTATILFDKIYPVSETMLKRAIMLAFHLVQHENEVKKLKWKNFERNTVTFKRQKTGEDIKICYATNTVLIEFLEATMKKRSEICPYLIFHRDLKGGFVPYQSFRSMWEKALVTAGYKPGDFVFKEIRHLANTLMKDAGVQIEKRKAMTGHITDTANLIYTHETDADTLDASRALSAYRPEIF